MTTTTELSAIPGPSAWRGDELAVSTEWIYELSDAERTALEYTVNSSVPANPLPAYTRSLNDFGSNALGSTMELRTLVKIRNSRATRMS